MLLSINNVVFFGINTSDTLNKVKEGKVVGPSYSVSITADDISGTYMATVRCHYFV
jgi:hypothetical protein